MENIKIQKITASDVEFLFRLMNDPAILKALHEAPTQLGDWKEAIAAWQMDEDEEGCIVFDGDTPIGWFAVNGLQAGDGTAFLKMAGLLPVYQNRKIGRYVLERIVDGLRAAKFTSVALFTDQDNTCAQRCYASCGFRVVEALEERMSDGALAARYKMECRL